MTGIVNPAECGPGAVKLHTTLHRATLWTETTSSVDGVRRDYGDADGRRAGEEVGRAPGDGGRRILSTTPRRARMPCYGRLY